MPPARRTLATAAVARVSAAMFALPARECFGLEIEWPAHRREDVSARPSAEDIAWLERGTLPAGGRITLEPGGQVEPSTPPPPSPATPPHAAQGPTPTPPAPLAVAPPGSRTPPPPPRPPPPPAPPPGLDPGGKRGASLGQAIWGSIAPPRTHPVRTDLAPELAWQEYALAADVMFINTEGSCGTSGTPDCRSAAGWPTATLPAGRPS